jgi:hypothetical protein
MKKTIAKNIAITFLVSAFVCFLSCAGKPQYGVRPAIVDDMDRDNIPMPKERQVSLYEDGIENVLGREIDDYFNLSRHIRLLTDNPKEAKNLNAFDEVPNSSWFTNRHYANRMSREALQRGPNKGPGPDMSGQLTVTGAKVEGVSPGFTIKDSKGDTYFIKFDIAGFPQLNTVSEVISTKFVHACGYNVPENYLSVLDPQKLRIAEGVTVFNEWGRRVPMTSDDLKTILQRANKSPDGTYRIVASKFLEGRPIGPFLYVGRRKDDPNDHIPHNHRRELRGYRVLAAWLNNFDTKANNTLDMYITENDAGYVKHHIIDFGTSLGASGYGVSARDRGHRGFFDVWDMIKRAVTLGFWVSPWEKEPRIITPSVGYFESRLFDPGHYAFIVPNPAFQDATGLDGFWGAKLIMAFTDDDISAIVETGEYARKQDEDYIVKTLIERRDKTGRYWYAKINPLDNFRITGTPAIEIAFEDLAVDAGFYKATDTKYRYRLRLNGENATDFITSSLPKIVLGEKTTQNLDAHSQGRGVICSIQVATIRAGKDNGKPVKVYFYYKSKEETPVLVALERES